MGMVASRAQLFGRVPESFKLCNMNICYHQPMARLPTMELPPTGEDQPAGWTIDELARAAGTTTRQVRALQTLGLLPHPGLVGRTGYYDAEHLDRLRAILRLQAEGFSLASLRSLLRAWESDMTLGDVLGLRPQPVRVAMDDADAFGALAGTMRWSSSRRGRLLSLVPSTILDQAAAS
jgi:DNA-binding transcriptional MerR regulator